MCSSFFVAPVAWVLGCDVSQLAPKGYHISKRTALEALQNLSPKLYSLYLELTGFRVLSALTPESLNPEYGAGLNLLAPHTFPFYPFLGSP